MTRNRIDELSTVCLENYSNFSEPEFAQLRNGDDSPSGLSQRELWLELERLFICSRSPHSYRVTKLWWIQQVLVLVMNVWEVSLMRKYISTYNSNAMHKASENTVNWRSNHGSACYLRVQRFLLRSPDSRFVPRNSEESMYWLKQNIQAIRTLISQASLITCLVSSLCLPLTLLLWPGALGPELSFHLQAPSLPSGPSGPIHYFRVMHQLFFPVLTSAVVLTQT